MSEEKAPQRGGFGKFIKVLVAVLIVVAIAWYWTFHRTSGAVAEAQVRIVSRNKAEVGNDYIVIHMLLLKSPVIIERAITKGKLAELSSSQGKLNLAAEIGSMLRVSRSEKASNTLVVRYFGPNSADCVAIENAILDSYRELLDLTYKDRGGGFDVRVVSTPRSRAAQAREVPA